VVPVVLGVEGDRVRIELLAGEAVLLGRAFGDDERHAPGVVLVGVDDRLGGIGVPHRGAHLVLVGINEAAGQLLYGIGTDPWDHCIAFDEALGGRVGKILLHHDVETIPGVLLTPGRVVLPDALSQGIVLEVVGRGCSPHGDT
jgi:hypothetical protein